MRVSRHYDDGAVANDGVRLAAGVGVAVAVATTGIVIVNVYRLKLWIEKKTAIFNCLQFIN